MFYKITDVDEKTKIMMLENQARQLRLVIKARQAETQRRVDELNRINQEIAVLKAQGMEAV